MNSWVYFYGAKNIKNWFLSKNFFVYCEILSHILGNPQLGVLRSKLKITFFESSFSISTLKYSTASEMLLRPSRTLMDRLSWTKIHRPPSLLFTLFTVYCLFFFCILHWFVAFKDVNGTITVINWVVPCFRDTDTINVYLKWIKMKWKKNEIVFFFRIIMYNLDFIKYIR